MSPRPTVPDTRLQIGLLEDLIELMPLATLAMNENRSILFANCWATELLGWKKEQFAGRKLATLIPEQFREACERTSIAACVRPSAGGLSKGCTCGPSRRMPPTWRSSSSFGQCAVSKTP